MNDFEAEIINSFRDFVRTMKDIDHSICSLGEAIESLKEESSGNGIIESLDEIEQTLSSIAEVSNHDEIVESINGISEILKQMRGKPDE